MRDRQQITRTKYQAIKIKKKQRLTEIRSTRSTQPSEIKNRISNEISLFSGKEPLI